MDKELSAMQLMVDMDPLGRRRVLEWAWARFVKTPTVNRPLAPPAAQRKAVQPAARLGPSDRKYLDAMKAYARPVDAKRLGNKVNRSRSTMNAWLSVALKRGMVKRVGHGLYEAA